MGEHRSRNENSGLIDLDALMREASQPDLSEVAAAAPSEPALPTNPSRAAAGSPPRPPPRAEDSLEAVVTTTREPSPPKPEPEIISPPPPPVSERPTRPEGLRPKAGDAPTPRVRIMMLGGVALLAVAAGAWFVSGRGADANASAPAPTSAMATRPMTASVPAAPTATAVPEAPPSSPAALSAAELVAAPQASATPAPKTARHVATTAPRAEKAADEPAPIVLPPSPAGGDLGDAMRGAVGPREASAKTAEETHGAPGARQVRPSPGAVVGAINAVLPEARACLGPDDPIRAGSIVFKSDGSVAQIALQGDKPVDGCIRAALTKAKVAPFVDDTFTTRVTVRP